MLTWSAQKTGHVVRQGNDSDSDLPPRAPRIGRGRSQIVPVDASPSSLEQGPGSLQEIYGSVGTYPIMVSCGLR